MGTFYLCSGLMAWFYVSPDLHKAPIIEHELEQEVAETGANCSVELEQEDSETGANCCESLETCQEAFRAMEAQVQFPTRSVTGVGPELGAPRAIDPFSALMDASCDSMRLLWHVYIFANEAIVAVIWPWPVESMLALPDFDVKVISF